MRQCGRMMPQHGVDIPIRLGKSGVAMEQVWRSATSPDWRALRTQMLAHRPALQQKKRSSRRRTPNHQAQKAHQLRAQTYRGSEDGETKETRNRKAWRGRSFAGNKLLCS